MPVTNFQPVIGSSFDAVTGQQFQWTQANRQQEEANLARMQQANRDYNNWLATVSQMNRGNAYAQQQMGREDYQIALTREAQAARDAEARRQFNASLEYSRQANKEAMQARKDQFEYELKLTKAEEDKQRQVLRNFGENYAPSVKAAATQWDAVNQEYQDAMSDVMTFGQKKVSELAIPGLTYDASRQKIIQTNPRIPLDPRDQARVYSANEEIAQRSAGYAGVKSKLDAAQRYWQDVQKQVADNGFIVKGQGESAYIYSPSLGQSFGEMVKAAGGTPGPRTEARPEFSPAPVTGNSIRVGGVTIGNPTGTGGFVPALSGNGAGASFQPGPAAAVSPEIAALKRQALEAISRGANPEAVRKRFRDITGTMLD